MSEYSTDGPICPYCGFEHTPDDPDYYNDSNTSFECGECEKSFAVMIDHTTSWTTSRREDGE